MDKEDKRRFFVIISAFVEVVMPVLRNRIERDFRSKKMGSFRDFLNSKPILHKLFHLCFTRVGCCSDTNNCTRINVSAIFKSQWKKLFAENPSICGRHCHCKFTANPIHLQDIDITLAATILRNCCNLSHVEMNSIETLRDNKNSYVSHNTKGTITEKEFKTIWSVINDNIKKIDMSKSDDLDKIEKRTLDETLCQQYHTQCMDMCKSVQDVCESVEKIEKKMDINQTQIDKKIDKKIEDMTQVILGSFIWNEETSRHSVRHANLQFKQEIDMSTMFHGLEKALISDGFLADEGLIVLASWKQSAIIFFKIDEAWVDIIKVEYSPFDITAMDKTAVAITLPEAMRIDIYEITSKRKLRSIDVFNCCFKLTSIKSKLIVACNENKLLIVDEIRDVIFTIETLVSADDSLHSSNDRIYHSNYDSNSLTCYQDDGIKIYNISLGGKPQGITSILDSRLLILMKDGTLRLASSDGNTYRHLEYKDHILQDPRIISYNHKLRQLFIANRHGIFHVYKVQKIELTFYVLIEACQLAYQTQSL